MRVLAVVVAVLLLLVIPAGVALALTGNNYLTTTHDIGGLQVKITAVCPARVSNIGYQVANPGPQVTLQFTGVGRTALQLAELNFDLTGQGRTLARASTFQALPIPTGEAATVTVETTLDQDNLALAQETFKQGASNVELVGRARVLLAHRTDSVWLNLRSPLTGIGCTR